jgi:hypothetical protein
MEGSLQRYSSSIFDSYKADQAITPSTLSGSDVLGPYLARAWADLSNVNRLCPRCESVPWMLLIDHKEKRTSLYEPPIQLETLRSSAHAGCHLCTLILASLLATRFRRERDGNNFLEEATMYLEDTSELQVDIDWDELDTGRVRQYLKLEIPDSSFGWGGKQILDMLSLTPACGILRPQHLPMTPH